MRVCGYGAVSGWASLRWQGANFFDGTGPSGRALPVPILRAGGGPRLNTPQSIISRAELGPEEHAMVRGLRCATPNRALFDEIRRAGSVRMGVVAVDMTLAAALTTLDSMCEDVVHRQAWTGVPLVREVMALASPHSRSPQESRMRLIWLLDAGLPDPLVNQPVFNTAGRLLGIPDLFDASTGLVGEYDGADHKDRDRHRRDVARAERFRNHGLEYFEVVGGDMTNRALCVERMLSAQRRASRISAADRGWTLEQPAWWRTRSR